MHISPRRRRSRAMRGMNGDQFIEYIMPLLTMRMVEYLLTADNLVEDAAQAIRDLDHQLVGLGARGAALDPQVVEMGMGTEETIGSAQEGGAEFAIGTSDQRARSPIDLTALVTQGSQAGASGNPFGRGLVAQGSQFGGAVGDGRDLQAGTGEHPDVRRATEAFGPFGFAGVDFLGFVQSFPVASQGEASVNGGSGVGIRGVGGPGQHRGEAAAVEVNALLAEQAFEAIRSELEDVLGPKDGLGNRPGAVVFPEVMEGMVEVTRAIGIEVLVDASTGFSGVRDARASRAGDEEKRGPEFIENGLAEGKAVEGGTMQSGKIMVIGFVAGMLGLSERFGSKGVNTADIKGGIAEDVLDDPMVASGAFAGADKIFYLSLLYSIFNELDSVVECGTLVREGLEGHQDVAVEISKHPFSILFVAIEAGQAKV